MKKIKTLLLTLLIATFLLPFTPPGCNDMRNNKEKTEKNNLETKSIQRDTLVQNKSDSINIITNNQQVPDSSELSSNETSELDSLTIFQRVLIYPDAKNLSGTGYLIHYFVKEYFFVFFAFLIPFLLLLQNIFSVKFIVSHDKYLLLAGFLFVTMIAILHFDNVVWGFWITIGVYFITTLVNFLNKET